MEYWYRIASKLKVRRYGRSVQSITLTLTNCPFCSRTTVIPFATEISGFESFLSSRKIRPNKSFKHAIGDSS